MALRAIRDTFGTVEFPTVGDPVEVRRQVRAGDVIPPGMRVSPGDVEDDGATRSGVLGEPPAPSVPAPSTRSSRRGRRPGEGPQEGA